MDGRFCSCSRAVLQDAPLARSGALDPLAGQVIQDRRRSRQWGAEEWMTLEKVYLYTTTS